jgi:hypothetical protein
MNSEIVVFVLFCQLYCTVKFDMFTDRILGFDRYGIFSAPNFRFRCFRNTDIVFVSGVTAFDFVSDKKYENGNGFSVYRPFSSLCFSAPEAPGVIYPPQVAAQARY